MFFFVLLVLVLVAKLIGEWKTHTHKIVVWQRVLYCYLNLRSSRAHVVLKCISSDHTYRNARPVTSVIPRYLFISCHRVLYCTWVARPLSPALEPRFASLSLIRVSYVYPCASLGHVPVSRISVCRGTLMSWSLSGHWVVHMSHFCGTACTRPAIPRGSSIKCHAG